MKNVIGYAPDGKVKANAFAVVSGSIKLYVSYRTIIAFYTNEGGLVISENVWGTTTGKHLNWIDPDKSKRFPRGEFETLLQLVQMR
jgi:hypothetical protein